jgi:aryl-alcohol dehydrogenase-like predicted oxidoreductase
MAMEYRKLGQTDLMVSELCLGTMTFLWTSTEQESYEVLDAAWEAGINFLDSADVYSRWAPGNPGGVAETIIGKWLSAREHPRARIIVATKVRGRMWEGPDGEGLSRTHIMRAVEDSLRRLQTDYIDLYQAHSPDAQTPVDETLRAFDDLVQQGKVRYIGLSNYSAEQLTDVLKISSEQNLTRVQSLQPHYNLIWRGEFESALMPLCAKLNIGVIPYSPLQGGFLTGKYQRGKPIPRGSRGVTNERMQTWMKDERALSLLDSLQAVAEARGESMAQTALAWLLSNPVITSPIIGANNVTQLQESLLAVRSRLTADQMQQLDYASAWA